VNVQDLDCDFLAFSGHKLLGPTGVGVLYARPDILENMEPFHGGGEMIGSVTMEKSTWNEIPWKFEAGTPNIAQVIGLGAAIEYVQHLGIENIEKYINQLTAYAHHALATVPGMTIYGGTTKGGSAIPFNLDDIHPHDLAQILDQEGIAVRAGHHCAQPIMQRLGVSATARASVYLYNQPDEIDRLVKGLEAARKFMGLK
jgi:cysteine desulfurase/selenocysteine lyase